MQTTEFSPFTRADFAQLQPIVTAAESKCQVYRGIDDGQVIQATARSLVDEHGAFFRGDADIRGAYLWVTTRSGSEQFWPVSELMELVRLRTFVVKS